jgi:hypothetical protein
VEPGLTRQSTIVINAAIERGAEIFGTTDRAISREYLKKNNAISSLALVMPEQVEFYRDEQYEKQRVGFKVDGTDYDLPITDPQWRDKIREQEFTHMPASAYIEGDERLVFTISLGEPFKGDCYKLVAAVFTMPPDKIIEY